MRAGLCAVHKRQVEIVVYYIFCLSPGGIEETDATDAPAQGCKVPWSNRGGSNDGVVRRGWKWRATQTN